MFDKSVEGFEKLEKWRENMGIIVNDKISVKNNKEYGMGVYCNEDIDVKEGDDDDNDDDGIELMRIPLKCTLSLVTFKEIIEKLSDEEKTVFKECLRLSMKFINYGESEILIVQLIAMNVLQKKGFKNEKLEDFYTYFDVLMNCKVNGFNIENEDAINDFREEFSGNLKLEISLLERERWERVSECINENMNVEVNVVQIVAAVRSRVLEIPRVDEEEEEEESDEEEESGFYVDITLVPILDYVNHDCNYNAKFDVDIKTGDILLIGNKDFKFKKGDQIFISYDELEDLHNFISTYGFIPKGEGNIKVIDLPIFGYCGDKDMNEINDYLMTSRLDSLNETPLVRFAIEFKDGKMFSRPLVNDKDKRILCFIDDLPWGEWSQNDVDNRIEDKIGDKNEDKNEDESEGQRNIINYEERYKRGYEQLLKEDKDKLTLKFHQYIDNAIKNLKDDSITMKELIMEYENQQNSPLVEILEIYNKMGVNLLEFPDSSDDYLSDLPPLETPFKYNWAAPYKGGRSDTKLHTV